MLKLRILIIAPSLPRYDRNSGDLRLYTILQILAEVYEVYFYACKIEYDDQQYLDKLQVIGITVFDDNMSIANVLHRYTYDVAFIEFYFIADYYLPRIRLIQPRCPIIIDTVDVHYIRKYSQSNITNNNEDIENANITKNIETKIYNKADVVITVTPDDAKLLSMDCPKLRIRIIPNIHEINCCSNNANDHSIIFIGGFTHEPNIDAILFFHKEVLPIIRKSIPGIQLKIVGSAPTKDIIALQDENIIVTGFVSSTSPYLHASKISIAPLRFGAGMKGKIGEAMAHGVPVVTTSVGAQGMGLTNRKNVIIADTPEDFAHAVEELINDAELYNTIKQNAIMHVADRYTKKAVTESIKTIIDEVKNSPSNRNLIITIIQSLLSVFKSLINSETDKRDKYIYK
ncbi:glycosyltransferase [Geobacter sp. AOG2]|uniref:glycosyltransferase n=1 Tax=Geobacter sp. AOG2 TaxID=1566347 RepID=UPI001CC6098C|nr:glycosyltransferase [Geobacter sp. AOG2]GFE60838.1 hypothetical protein AOG2_14260 [Geobacter sp. AOG2]